MVNASEMLKFRRLAAMLHQSDRSNALTSGHAYARQLIGFSANGWQRDRDPQVANSDKDPNDHDNNRD
jgi:hypothetical protein